MGHVPGRARAGQATVLIAAVLIVAGLLGSLRVRRRRFWLRAVPVPASDGSASRRTVVTAAGLARNDAGGFVERSSAIWSLRSVGLADGSAGSEHRGRTDVAANLHLAHTSDVLLTWAVFCYAFAMLGYAAEFAAGRRAEARRRKPGCRRERVDPQSAARVRPPLP